MLDIETYKLRASASYSPRTLEKRLIILRKYDEFLKERGLEIGPESLMLWLDELQKNGYSNATLSAYAHAVLSYFDLMLIKVDERSLKAIKRRLPQVSNENVEYLTDDEVARLIQVAPPHRKVLYAITYAYARRLGEVLLLRWNDIDMKNDTITFTILKKKSNERATYKLERWIKDMLQRYKSFLGSDKLFTITERAVERAFKRDCERAGIPAKNRRLRPHLLRHSRATSLRARGVPIDVVSKYLLKHSHVETTVRFYRAVTEKEVHEIPEAGDILEQTAG